MSRAKESFSSAVSRIHPEGIVIAQTFGFITPWVAGPTSERLASTIHQFHERGDPDLARTLTIAALVAITYVISVARENRTLNKRRYRASATTNYLNVGTGRPAVSSAGGHVLGAAQLLGLTTAAELLFSGGSKQLLTEGVPAALITTACVRTATNTLVLRGWAEPLVQRIKEGEGLVARTARRTMQATKGVML